MPSITIKAAAEGTKDANAGTEDVSHSLVIFLQSQSQNMLTRLYQKPSACLSIFRWESWESSMFVAKFKLPVLGCCGPWNDNSS